MPADRIYDAIESALWQGLADTLNRLEAAGIDPIAGIADQLGAKPIRCIDAGDVIHGGGIRESGEGYFLRYQVPFTPGPDGEDLPSGWVVAPRAKDSAL